VWTLTVAIRRSWGRGTGMHLRKARTANLAAVFPAPDGGRVGRCDLI